MTSDEQVHNEQMKSLATWYNSLSNTILAAGVVAPAVSFLFDIKPIPLTALTAVAVVLWVSTCIVLRLQAHWTLQRLIFDEPD